jgi:hypothetical protein
VTTGSTSSTRTPPPRRDRGAPSSTSTAARREPATAPRRVDNGRHRPTKTAKGPTPTPASTKVFNWDDDRRLRAAQSAASTAAITCRPQFQPLERSRTTT